MRELAAKRLAAGDFGVSAFRVPLADPVEPIAAPTFDAQQWT
jgi:hypothetical protein